MTEPLTPEQFEVTQERSQALARVAITAVVCAYLWGLVWGGDAPAAVGWGAWFVTAYLIYSLGFNFVVRAWRGRYPARRMLGIVTDLSGTSVAVFALGASGAALYPIYLWIIVGNGLRFGVRYMTVATVVGVATFAGVVVLSPYWTEHWPVSAGFLAGMIILPVFYAANLGRLHRARADLERQVEKTAHAATHDSLTGVANRAHFIARADAEAARTDRSGRPCALLFMDLDGFKRVNDTYGHNTGDALLVAVAERIRRSLRRIDTLGRLGGDEFVVLAPELRADADAHVVATRLLTAVAEPYLIGEREFRLTASIGVALCPGCTDQATALLRAADSAMYRAKHAGGSRYELARTGDDGPQAGPVTVDSPPSRSEA